MKIAKSFLTTALLLISLYSSAQGLYDGPWNGKLSLGDYSLTIAFNIGEKTTMDSPDEGVRGVPAEASVSPAGVLEIRVPSLNISYSGLLRGDIIAGTFTQNGQSLPLTLNRGELKRVRKQTPQPPFPYETVDYRFTNGDALLCGTLSLPQGWNRSTPCVIMVTGSGSQNRDEELMDHKPFAVIADALARCGIASLRYDDRGFAESTGDVKKATTKTFAEDAAAGIDSLHKSFDHVGVIGHSEGGTIAFMLASEGKPDFIVSLAGMADRGDSTVFRQSFKGALLYGMSDEQAEAVAQSTLQTFMKSGLPWTDYFVNLDPREFIPSIKCPALVLNGEKDVQVIPEFNAEIVRKLLPAADVRIYPDLNHLFQHCTTGAVLEYANIEETFSQEVLDDIIAWIRDLYK